MAKVILALATCVAALLVPSEAYVFLSQPTCPPGYADITTYDECNTARISLGFSEWIGLDSMYSSYRRPYCFIGKSNNANFNPGGDLGSSWGLSKGVLCALSLASAPTPALTPAAPQASTPAPTPAPTQAPTPATGIARTATSSLGYQEQTLVFIGNVLGLLISFALISHAMARRGLAAKFWKSLFSKLPPEDARITRLVDEKVDTEVVYYGKCINFLMTITCSVLCARSVFLISFGLTRWMTFGQDVIWIWATLSGVVCQLLLRRFPTTRMVNINYVIFMLGQTAFVSLGPCDRTMFAAVAGFTAYARLLWSLAAMRLPLVVLLIVMHFFCVLAGYASTSSEGALKDAGPAEHTQVVVMLEFIGDVGIVLAVLVWRRISRERALREIRASASQGENRAARKLLNTVCDATIELDGDLRIVDGAPRLACLLQQGADRSLHGASPLQFVVDEDKESFGEKMAAPVDGDSMANVFNVRMRDGISNVLTVEMFHVPIANVLTGAAHLIGIKDFSDADEKPGSLMPLPLQTPLQKGVRKAWKRSIRAGSSSGQVGEELAQEPGEGYDTGAESNSSPAGSSQVPDGVVAIWFDVLSSEWTLRRAAGCVDVLLGSPRDRRGTKGPKLLKWIKPDQREATISWVQQACQRLMLPPASGSSSSGSGLVPEPARADLRLRPPLLHNTSVTMLASATLSLSLSSDSQTLVQMTLADIRLGSPDDVGEFSL
jgi:hypothetical protein